MKDWINEWYNDQFEKIDLTPSSNVWENISQTMEDWPKHWYASNVDDLGSKPRKTTWEQLNSHLSDQRRVQRSNRFSYTAASVILTLLLVVPFSTEDSLFSDYFQKEFITNSVSFEGSDLITQTNKIASVESSQRNMYSEVDSKINENKSLQQEQIIRPQETVKPQSFIEPLTTINVVSKSDIQGVEERVETSVNTLPILRSRYEENTVASGLRFSNLSTSRNWLEISLIPQLSTLNNPISQTALSSDDVSLFVRPSMTFSVSAGHKFDQRNGIKLALLLNNQKGLRVNSSNEDRKIDLNYISLAALYTSSWDLGQNSRFALNTELGLMAGFNTNMDVLFNEERVDYLESGYGKFDAGVMIGASISTTLSDHWSLSTGVNSQIGLMNVFKGNNVIPSDFFRTTTQSIGLNIGLIRTF